MLELSTVTVDILVHQRPIAASNMLVRRTSLFRAINAECSSQWDSELGPDRIYTQQRVYTVRVRKGIRRRDRLLRIAPEGA